MSTIETTLHYDHVHQFMQGAKQATPEGVAVKLSFATRELRARLILEEAFELINDGLGIDIHVRCETHPIHASDFDLDCHRPISLAMILDGHCDLHVVSTGTLIAAGLRDMRPQILVDQNNLEKLGPGSSFREDGKLIKPEWHRPPDLEAEVARQVEQFGWEQEE